MSTPVTVITGASRGIGKRLAIDLARAGWDVVCAARSSQDSPSKLPGTVDDTAAAVVREGRRAMPVALDVQDEDAVAALAERVYAEWGRCDLLINNAAIAPPRPALQDSIRRWRARRRRQPERPVLSQLASRPAHGRRRRRPRDQRVLGRRGDAGVRASELHGHQARAGGTDRVARPRAGADGWR